MGLNATGTVFYGVPLNSVNREELSDEINDDDVTYVIESILKEEGLNLGWGEGSLRVGYSGHCHGETEAFLGYATSATYVPQTFDPNDMEDREEIKRALTAIKQEHLIEHIGWYVTSDFG